MNIYEHHFVVVSAPSGRLESRSDPHIRICIVVEVFVYPIPVRLWASIALHYAAEDLNPMQNLNNNNITQPEFDPNSGPATVQIFLATQGAYYKYAFKTSAAYTSTSFSPVIVNANCTLSHKTTEEYVIDAGANVL